MTWEHYKDLSKWIKKFVTKNNITIVVPAKAPPPLPRVELNPDTVIIDYPDIIQRPEDK